MPDVARRLQLTRRRSRSARRDGSRRGAIGLANCLTLTRAAAAPLVVALYLAGFHGHAYWATGLFVVAMTTDWFDGRIARRRGGTSALGSLLDPVADKVLVLCALIVLVGDQVVPGWMVAAIVARELLVSGLRLAAAERGLVLAARDLAKLKTWSQATAAAVAGLAAAGAWSHRVAWWTLLVAVLLTWLSGLDYARLAPALLRGEGRGGGARAAGSPPRDYGEVEPPTFSSSPARRHALR